MARNYVRTVTDMERYYYGAGNAMGYSYTGSELLKADSPMLSSTAGTYQAIYGRKVWSQLNQEFNAFSILPKRPWDRSGWRVITEKPNAGVLHGGLAENGVLPDTVKPVFQHVAAKPKTIADRAAGQRRTFSLDQLDDVFQRMWELGGNPKVMLTGYDTLMRLQQLLQAQQRFMEEKRVTPTYNGVKGVPGIEAGFIVATYNGVPIIPSKDVEKDGISRVYFLDTDYLYFSTAIPTQYFESGIETGDPFAINRLGQEGLYRTMGEVWTTFFRAQGSIRDLS
jgi:hypothetical protein